MRRLGFDGNFLGTRMLIEKRSFENLEKILAKMKKLIEESIENATEKIN